MKLIVGLGNPGRKYEKTRHNIGFSIAGAVADRLGIEVKKEKFQALFGIGKINNNDVCIIKPQTFMNLSGEAVQQFASYYKVEMNDILVIQDDIDMVFARLKFIFASGAGGHNGIASIIDMFGGEKNFYRLKVGVGRPFDGIDPADYVLQNFARDDRDLLEKLIETSADAVLTFFKEGPAAAMQKYN